MIDLTDTKAIYARAREAYANKELQAQKSDPGKNCSYNGPCAIGVYLTPEQRNELEPGGADDSLSIFELLNSGKIKGDLGPLGDLQEAHDNWVFSKNEHAYIDPEAAEANFVEILEKY